MDEENIRARVRYHLFVWVGVGNPLGSADVLPRDLAIKRHYVCS